MLACLNWTLLLSLSWPAIKVLAGLLSSQGLTEEGSTSKLVRLFAGFSSSQAIEQISSVLCWVLSKYCHQFLIMLV